jgi:hypothetical protein
MFAISPHTNVNLYAVPKYVTVLRDNRAATEIFIARDGACVYVCGSDTFH